MKSVLLCHTIVLISLFSALGWSRVNDPNQCEYISGRIYETDADRIYDLDFCLAAANLEIEKLKNERSVSVKTLDNSTVKKLDTRSPNSDDESQDD